MSTRLTRNEVIKAHSILSQHLKNNGDYWDYDQDWDDNRIAKLINDKVTPATIGKLRTELFGQLRKVGNSGGFGERYKLIDERLTKIEEMGINLMKLLEELKQKHIKLCENLTINRVLDVKHLK